MGEGREAEGRRVRGDGELRGEGWAGRGSGRKGKERARRNVHMRLECGCECLLFVNGAGVESPSACLRNMPTTGGTMANGLQMSWHVSAYAPDAVVMGI